MLFKVIGAAGVLNGKIDRLAHEIELGRFVVLFGEVNTARCFAHRVLDHRQMMLITQLI